MHYYYNALAQDANSNLINWGSIRLDDQDYFYDNRFLFLTWQNRNSDAPTEIYLPRHMNTEKLIIISESKIINGTTNLLYAPEQSTDEIVITYERDR